MALANEISLPKFSSIKSIFAGPKGIRAGWRLLIFFLLLGVPGAILLAMAHGQATTMGQTQITPFLLGANDTIVFLVLVGTTWVMGKIERCRFAEYGLPVAGAFRKDFWIGSLIGFLTISSTLLVMSFLHAFSIAGLALHGMAILPSVGGWSIAFVLVGLFEEFAFRGYLQYTLRPE